MSIPPDDMQDTTTYCTNIHVRNLTLRELDLYKVIKDLQIRVDQLEGKYPVAQKIKTAELFFRGGGSSSKIGWINHFDENIHFLKYIENSRLRYAV